MDIEQFMRGYKVAWETRDESRFCALFTVDGVYRNTPFAEQRGAAQLAKYWQRVKLQADIELTYEILASSAGSGLAHWHVAYQVTSEELFQIWAVSTGNERRSAKIRRPVAPHGIGWNFEGRFRAWLVFGVPPLVAQHGHRSLAP